MVLLKKQTLKEIFLSENIQLIGISVIAFAVPFFFKQPQIVIGSIINFLLIMAVSKYEIKKILPILFLPSIASLLSGVLFGTFTLYLVYLIPFIVLSNLIYILSFKYIHIKYLNTFLGALLKACFLFSCAYILFDSIHIPEIFLTTMGIVQFYTALIGGITASIFLSLKHK